MNFFRELLRTKFIVMGAAAGLGAASAAGAELTFDLLPVKAGELPAGFRPALAGAGEPGDWRVINDPLAPLIGAAGSPAGQRKVIAQLSRDPADERFPLLIYDGQVFDDFSFSVRLKLVDGRVEQMAGVAFRLQDEKNFYVVRASGLGRTLKFYKVVNGQRDTLIGPELEIPRGEWHELTIECNGNTIRCLWNGTPAMPTLNDNTFSRGRIALWTKSDSVSYFADARIRYEPREPPAASALREALDRYPRLVGLQIFAGDSAGKDIRLVASKEAQETGKPAGRIETDVITTGTPYYGKERGTVRVTLPVHDRNGDAIAAVRIIMKSFAGQTEANAIARAVPIAKFIEARLQSTAR